MPNRRPMYKKKEKFFGFEEKRKGIVSILIFHLFSLFFLMKLKLLINRANTNKETTLLTMIDFYLVGRVLIHLVLYKFGYIEIQTEKRG